MNTTTANALPEIPGFGDVFETVLASRKEDAKGRLIGFMVGLYDNGQDFYAYVQMARHAEGWAPYGVRQRAKKFKNQADATKWAYATAHARIAAL